MTLSPIMTMLTIAGHGDCHVHVELELGVHVAIGGKPELEAGPEEVSELGVEEEDAQYEGDHSHWRGWSHYCKEIIGV